MSTHVLKMKPRTHILSGLLESAVTDWPRRGWRRPTPPSLPPCCQHTPPPPSSKRHPAPASLACRLLQLLASRGEPECWSWWKTHILPVDGFLSPATWAPGLTHRPKSTGSVHLVTVTMTSAALTASSTDTHAVTGPLTEWRNLSAPSLVRLHTRTCDEEPREVRQLTGNKHCVSQVRFNSDPWILFVLIRSLILYIFHLFVWMY